MRTQDRDQLMNARYKTIGKGAMDLASAIQDIRKPGERLMTVMFFLKCVCDSQDWVLSDLMLAVNTMEKEARQHQVPELAGARAYIENDFLTHD